MELKFNPNFNFKSNSINKPQNSSKQEKTPEPLKAKQPEAPENVKRGVLLTTALGVLTGLAIALKRGNKIVEEVNGKKIVKGIEKFSINPMKMFKGNYKNWGIMKLKYDESNVITLASSSILGGLAGGAIFDKKENMKAKIRESIIQMIGNILIPLACVAGGSRLFDKFLNEKVVKALNLSEKMKGAPKVIVSAICLLGAIFFGNKTSNFINEDIYHLKDDRGVKFADMSGHVDDTCLAISIANPGSKLSKVASRFIPLALMVCGYSSGVMQEWPDDVKATREVHHGSKIVKK